MTSDEFLAGNAEAKALFEVVSQAILATGEASMHVSKSQIAFRRVRGFAWVWMPGMYLKRKVAPLVLTLALSERNASPRWKQVVESAPGRFVHHLELFSAADVDGEVRNWIRLAWLAAG